MRHPWPPAPWPASQAGDQFRDAGAIPAVMCGALAVAAGAAGESPFVIVACAAGVCLSWAHFHILGRIADGRQPAVLEEAARNREGFR